MRNLRLVTILALGVAGALASVGASGVQTPVAPAQVTQAVPPPRPATVVWQPATPQGRGRGNSPAPPPLVATGILVGKVVDAASGKPVAGATVTLSGGPTRTAPPAPTPGVPVAPAMPPPPPPRLLTDAEGRFAFRSLTRGNYQLAAEKPGYASGAFGRARPSGPTRPLQLDDNERMVDVAIRVFKLASIAGLVSDERGEPIVNVPVRAYRRALVSGRRVLTQAGQVQTDDRGMYRLFNLTPAEYVIAVPMQSTSSPGGAAGSADARQNMSSTSQNLNGPTVLLAGGRQLSADGRFFWQSGSNAPLVADGSGRWRSYATTYYPASPTIAAAEPIILASGDEKIGVDLTMRYVPVSDVSGVVFAPDGLASNYVLRLVASETGEMTSDPESATAVADANGAFTFLAVPAGQYVIATVRPPRETDLTSAPSQPLLWAMTPISVGDIDLGGLSLTLREGLTVSGRMEFTGSRPRPTAQQLSQIPLVVEPASGRDNTPTSGPPSRVQPDGRFVTAPRMPGKYFLRVGGQPAGFIVQSIIVNGVDGTESPFDLTSQNLSNVVVTFTDLISTLGGTVRGTPPGSDPPAVVLFPADSRAWKDFGVNPARMRMTRTGATGNFNFGSLINGSYFVTAIRDEFSSEWQDPAFLEVLSHTAQRLTLGAGEKRTVDLPLSDAKPPSIRRAPSPLALSDPDTTPTAVAGGPFVPENDPQNPVRDGRAPPAEPAGTGSISGVVIVDDAGAARPGRLARVTARGGGLTGERSALTDDDGRFTIPWLPAGEYTVMVTKPSYLTMYHGAKRPEAAPGTPVRVEAGKPTTGANVTLWRGAVVTGIVLDPLGQPAPNVRAQLQQYVVRNGERVLASASAGGASTDDRGAYRIYGVRPGSYVLSVTPQNANTNTELRQLSESEIRAAIAEASRTPTPLPAADVTRTIAPAPPGAAPVAPPAGQRVSYSPIYFPGTPRQEEAAEIVLTPGQEVNATIQIQLVPAARLEGRVVTPDGQTPPNAQITLQRLAATQSSSTIGVRYADGLFQAISVPVGRYSLNAWVELVTPRVPGATAAPAAPPRLLWAQQTIDVTGEDLMNLVLALGPPITISGRVVFDGATRPDPKTVQVRLESAGFPPPTRTPGGVSPDATGAFTITGVPAGKYRLIASVSGGPAQTWSLLASAMGGRDTIVTPLDIRGDESVSDAVVTLTDRPAEISGTLIDGDRRPVPGMIVVLFSADRSTWVMNPSRLNRMTAPSTDGTFRFSSTVPGEYYLAVVTEIDNNEWNDPAIKEQLAAAAIKVSVAKGEKKVQDLRVK